MATTVTMPQLGETVVEGTIIRWLKREGERIERDEPLFEISTDKVDTEVPSPTAGTVARILVEEGSTVSVGTELAQIEEGDGQAAAPSPSEAPTQVSEERGEPDAASARAEAPAPVEEAQTAEAASGGVPAEIQAAGEAPEPAVQRAPAEAEPPVPEAPAPPRPEPGPEPITAGDVGGPRSQILSPLVRRLAEEHQVDLSQIRGTGTGGRITKRDVLEFVEGKGAAAEEPEAASEALAAPPAPEVPPQVPVAPPAAGAPRAPAIEAVPSPAPPAAEPVAPAAAGPREEAVPMTHIRKAIAKHMVMSLQTSARAWNLVEVDMESIVRVREQAKDSFREREGFALTYMPFLARALCEALLAYPDVNGELRDDQIILKRYVNLGIAVAYEEGLIVPVVKGADEMNLVGLARAINDVAGRARAKRLKPDEVHGGTFTITNPGPFGSLISVPIINQPQCAILAFDTIEKRPVVVDDAIAIRHRVYLSMSWDHRIIDGATAAKFLARLKQNLETWDFGPELGLPAAAGP